MRGVVGGKVTWSRGPCVLLDTTSGEGPGPSYGASLSSSGSLGTLGVATLLFADDTVCLSASLVSRPLGTVTGRVITFLLLLDLGRGCLWEEPKGRKSIQQ